MLYTSSQAMPSCNLAELTAEEVVARNLKCASFDGVGRLSVRPVTGPAQSLHGQFLIRKDLSLPGHNPSML